MKNIKSFLVAFVFMSTSNSYGVSAIEVAPKGRPTPASAPAKSSITDSADKTKSSNAMGEILNMAMGAVEMAAGAYFLSTQCEPPIITTGCIMGPIMFLMGAQSFAQGGAQGKTAGQAGNTFGLTDTGLGDSSYDPSAVKALEKDPDMKTAREFMANVASGKAPFTYDAKTGTLTLQDGKTLKGSDLNSAASMAAAGIPKSAIDMLGSMEKDILAKAEKKVGKLNLATSSSEESSSGGGGGGSGSRASASSGEGFGARTGGSVGGLGIDRDPAQLAGMQKNYNGEPIGVAGDSIFKMMTRRYKTKEAQSSFIDESEFLMQK
ncbi:MAG TPA: hypothetical protein VIG33_10065 [Pseudobdellovibrionaceae bacterium]|jgi:hypothetical protein